MDWRGNRVGYVRHLVNWCQRPGMIKISRYHPSNIILVLTLASTLNSALLVAAWQNMQLISAAAAIWTLTGSLNYGRTAFSSALLGDGRVLVAGGQTGPVCQESATNTSEIYDPKTGSWTITGSLRSGRASGSMVRLQDGRVLRVDLYSLNKDEVYDPTTGEWTPTGSTKYERCEGMALTLLPNGKVLATGGLACSGCRNPSVESCEIYDPETGTWSTASSTIERRSCHSAVLLNSGKVLVVGGWSSGWTVATAELFDPATGEWMQTGSMAVARQTVATLLKDGRVLVSGGYRSQAQGGSSVNEVLSSCEIYDPNTGTWTVTGSMNEPRRYHKAVLLANGKVLIAGGDRFPSSAEIYDPATESWNTVGPLTVDRYDFQMQALPDGKVLVTGGLKGDDAVSTTETFDPETVDVDRVSSLRSELETSQSYFNLLEATTLTCTIALTLVFMQRIVKRFTT